MKNKKKLQIFIVTAAFFFITYIVYGIFGIITHTGNLLISFISFGIAGGYRFSSLLCSIMLFVRYIAHKNLHFKIISCCVFPVIIFFILYTGTLAMVPHFIYKGIRFMSKIFKDPDGFIH